MREVEDVNTFHSTTELPTSDSTVADDDAEKTNNNNWIFGVLFGILVCVIVCSVAIGLYIKRRREGNPVRTPSVTFNNNNEDPESQTTAAQKVKTKYKYFKELNRKTQFERRRYLSEGDKEENIPLTLPSKYQSQDYSSDEAQENTPLLGRKNADSSAIKEDFDEVKNRITEFDFKAPVCREDIRQNSQETPTGGDLGRSKRNVRKYSDAVEARVYVRPRRRVKSESEASASSAQLSYITEGGNCDKQISFKCLSG
ncbi:uncharacterized protein LOC134258227 [Saccostrea cucullata]|uniref:uncharacterized protein LOC134258227 n=1 Tax=Saccostrea cuccullata TaxID=36930 RepID=UPI002ED05B4D